MKPASRLACLAVIGLGATALVDCEALGSGALSGLSMAACPELGAGVNAAGAFYTSRADFNAKIGAFVVATKDLMSISAQAEAETAEACLRIGRDIGLNDAQMAPRDGAGGRAAGACNAVAARMDQILSTGLRFQVTVIPPQCQANGQAYASCTGQCSGQASGGGQVSGTTAQGGGSADAECNASCKAHAEFTASCTPAMVTVRANQTNEMALRLVASLQANLPLLLHAQIALGKRVLADADTMVQVGRNMPNIVAKAGIHAVSCVASAGTMTVNASASIKVSVQASAGVTTRAGAGG